ncbi:iron-containing redox enzyme family protein [Mycolicibacterium sp. 120266]|uniref:iron-containing redox enzyme family protein n=1 Tax=Mycolicibacterium sp. 120266 TaxID=3090601 RepID=UPI00299D9B53|nr:iron-containing redox enzyme family protein [Mycolicibacterium sp. 120266]MDX1874232.1 iron-containing redox enzyme family protein [Mycolicibacterium sp. 120266]
MGEITRGVPAPAGPLSGAVIDRLKTGAALDDSLGAAVAEADPYGLDLHVALQLCYELFYRGFTGVDARWEWDPALIELRGRLEAAFLADIRRDLGELSGLDAAGEMDRLSIEPVDGSGPSHFLLAEGSWEQMREYFVHRSIYHLKEADPHAWVIPRLVGQAKASFVAVEFDEFGGGRGPQVHQRLFADLMTAAGLDDGYLAYLEAVPAETLAVVNLMSMFGLHRRWRGATVGHFAATEITSSPGSQRLADALERMGAPTPCTRFYLEHVEADAVHEQVVRTDVVGDLLAREPGLEPDVVFGIRAFELVEDRLANHLMKCWRDERSSLLLPLS